MLLCQTLRNSRNDCQARFWSRSQDSSSSILLPFTEPSVEMDVSCFNCDGKGCPICKYTGWIEVLGAGMVHPNVLENAGVDSTVYGGFAFGLGLDRFAILKYGISDIRDFYTNDVRFLAQFRKEED